MSTASHSRAGHRAASPGRRDAGCQADPGVPELPDLTVCGIRSRGSMRASHTALRRHRTFTCFTRRRRAATDFEWFENHYPADTTARSGK